MSLRNRELLNLVLVAVLGTAAFGSAWIARTNRVSAEPLVDVAVIAWATSREVAAIDCHASPPRIQRLAHGGPAVPQHELGLEGDDLPDRSGPIGAERASAEG